MKTFNPNKVSFDEGLIRIQKAVDEARLDQRSGVITSRDKAARHAQHLLKVKEVPGGFRKWQLPVYLERASQLFLTVAEPGAKVPEHSHDEGDGIRFIAQGSIVYNGVELTAGDWMFIPVNTAHQHFNLDGDEPARFLSATSRVFKWLGVHDLEQLEAASTYRGY